MGTDPDLHRLWRLTTLGSHAVLAAGVVSAVVTASSWRPAAWLLVGAVTLLMVSRVAIGAVAYRRLMNRPWPRVEPLPDDDD